MGLTFDIIAMIPLITLITAKPSLFKVWNLKICLFLCIIGLGLSLIALIIAKRRFSKKTLAITALTINIINTPGYLLFILMQLASGSSAAPFIYSIF